MFSILVWACIGKASRYQWDGSSVTPLTSSSDSLGCSRRDNKKSGGAAFRSESPGKPEKADGHKAMVSRARGAMDGKVSEELGVSVKRQCLRFSG